MLAIFGLSLMICGALAYQAAGSAPKAISSIYVGNASALIAFLLAAGVRNPQVQKGDPGYKAFMICIHVAFVFPIVLGAVVSWRLVKAWPNPAKAYLLPYLAFMIVSCAVTALTIYLMKPVKPAAPEKKAKDPGTTTTASKETASKPASAVRRRARRIATE